MFKICSQTIGRRKKTCPCGRNLILSTERLAIAQTKNVEDLTVRPVRTFGTHVERRAH